MEDWGALGRGLAVVKAEFEDSCSRCSLSARERQELAKGGALETNCPRCEPCASPRPLTLPACSPRSRWLPPALQGRAPSSTAAISVRGSSPSTYSAQSWVYHSRTEFENLFDWILRLMQHDNGGFYLVVGPWSRYQKNYTRPCFPKPCNGTTRVTSPNNAIWNQIEVGGRSIQQSISVWWRGTDDAPPLFLVDSFWNATAVVPSTASVRINDDGADDASKIGAGRAPIVPWYDSHFFTNPSCRGYPWY